MTASPRTVRLTVLALATGAFAIGTSEFAAMGLLPFFAADLGVSEPAAGGAISAYALGVVAGAPTLAVLAARLSRRTLLAALMAVFALANLAGALAPDYPLFVATRFVAGLPHGAFLGIGSIFAASLMPPEKRAAGVAMVLTGLTLANTVGTPAAGALGQYVGWRTGFVLVAAIAALAALLVVRHAPADRPDPAASPLAELGALRIRAVWMTLLVGAVGFGGIFSMYAYLTATMIGVTEAPGWTIPLALSLFGLGGTIGTNIAGWASTRSRTLTALGCLVWMALTLAFYATSIHSTAGIVAAAFLVGSSAGLVVPLQARLMDVAGHAQALAAALNHAAFNLANALGPFLAGAALAAGWGWRAPGWVGVALALAGIAALALMVVDARARRPAGAAA